MKKYSRKRMNITFVILVLVLLISIGYAALTTVLKINSNISLGKAAFAIHFDNVETATHKATVIEEANITNEEKTEISFNVSIPRIGDYYRFTTDIVNEGSIPGKVKSIEIHGLTESQQRLISYKVSYTGSNNLVAVGDFFGPNSSKNVTVDVIYELSDDVENEDLPTDTLNLECEFIINFENGKIEEFRSRAASNKLSQSTHYMNSSAVNFGSTTNADEHEGLYVLNGTEDDDFPIYFYRGGHVKTKNNVLFAGFCWKIIRTTDTGGIKIMYNGTPNDEGQCMTTTGNATRTNYDYYGTNTYVGSKASRLMYAWYFDNLINYQSYLEDTVFCNKTVDSFTNYTTSLSCPEANQISVANGKNSYPVGLIDADEVRICGGTGKSQYPWLYTNQSYWVMTIAGSRHSWRIGVDGGFDGSYCITSESQYGMRPVVSLNSEVVLTEGDGSMENPYKVTLN